jgi:hypothetical protein
METIASFMTWVARIRGGFAEVLRHDSVFVE